MVDQLQPEWREPFLIRTNGGPASGTRVVRDGELGMHWPLPSLLGGDSTGQYAKVGESELPPQTEDSHVVRGAEYDWHPSVGAS